MIVLNFGSLNIDHVYSVDHILKEGETISSSKMNSYCGGKGLNQSIALARAGVKVFHAGMVGEDGQILIDQCQTNGVDTTYIKTITGKSGHTIIQVDKNGQNGILLFGGSNQNQSNEHIDEVLSHFGEGDILLLQNEVNLLGSIIEKAFKRGLKIALNPSPFDKNVLLCDLSKIDYFFINEIEGEQITGYNNPDEILKDLVSRFPKSKIILTLGKNGVRYCDLNETCGHDVFPVAAVDTTAAGDTFTGYFLSSISTQKTVKESLRVASMAASISVSRAGASASIPKIDEVLAALNDLPPV